MICKGPITIVAILVTWITLLTADTAATRLQKRVIGGNVYLKGDYPFHVSLWYMGDNNWFTAKTPGMHHTCGGSLVGDRWVLTAAACFDDNYLSGKGNLSLWEVYVGMYAQTDASTEAQYRAIDEVFRVPQYNFRNHYGDLALLKLNQSVTLGSSVGLAVINAEPNCPSVDQDVTVIGWGETHSQTINTGSDVPHQATVRVSDVRDCSDRYKSTLASKGIDISLRIDNRNICAGLPEGGVDGCTGDEGSPLLATCPGFDTPVIVGTSSYGWGCAQPGIPTVYTRVSSYHQWIVDTMAANSP